MSQCDLNKLSSGAPAGRAEVMTVVAMSLATGRTFVEVHHVDVFTVTGTKRTKASLRF